MTHDKFTTLASVTALAGLLSLTAVVGGGRRPLPKLSMQAKVELGAQARPLRRSLKAVGLLPVEEPVLEDQLAMEPQAPAQKVALPSNPGLPALVQCLDGALTETDLQSARDCIEEQLGNHRISPQELGSWVCGLQDGQLSQAQVLLEVALSRQPGSSVIPYSEAVQRACPGLQETDLLARAVLASRATQGDWSQALAEYLGPQQLFDPLASTLALGVAQQLAIEGNSVARKLIEEGASGLSGGSDEQILMAAKLGLELQVDGAESISFLTGLVESQFTPGRQGLGKVMAEALLEPAHWQAGDAASAIALLSRVIDDERFRLEAGRALAGRLSETPVGAEADAWQRLTQSAAFKHLEEQVFLVVPD